MTNPVMDALKEIESLCSALIVSSAKQVPDLSIDPPVRPSRGRYIETWLYSDYASAPCAEHVVFPTDVYASGAQWKSILDQAYARLIAKRESVARGEEGNYPEP